MQRFKLSAALAASLALAPAAVAQEYNVDLEVIGHPVPLQTFGGFLEQLGLWNPWTPTANHGTNPIPLDPVVGTGANTVLATTSTLNQSTPMLLTSGVPQAVRPLYEDYLEGNPGRDVLIDGLLPAEYFVTLYSWTSGDGGAKWRVNTRIGPNVTTTTAWQDLLYGTIWPGGSTTSDAYVRPGAGALHHNTATFIIDVEQGETLQLEAYCGLGSNGGHNQTASGGGGSIPAGGGVQTGNGMGGPVTGTEIIPPSPGDGTGCALNGYQLTPLVGESFCGQPLNTQGLEMRLMAWGTSSNGQASLMADDLTLALGVVKGPLPMPGTTVYTLASLDSTPNGSVHGCPRIGPLCVGTSNNQNITTLLPGPASANGTYSTTVSFGSIGGMPMAGSTVNFQCYYFDNWQGTQCASGAPNPVLRLSNALGVTLY